MINEPRIVCAAMRKETRIICGARHYDPVMRQQMIASEGLDFWKGCEQGFIDQFGNFLTREEAHKIAVKEQQIRKHVGGDKDRLFSENLY